MPSDTPAKKAAAKRKAAANPKAKPKSAAKAKTKAKAKGVASAGAFRKPRNIRQDKPNGTTAKTKRKA